MTAVQSEVVSTIKKVCQTFINDKLLNSKSANTMLGSVTYLFFGKQVSLQSLNIKLGRFGEFLPKEIIRNTNHLSLLPDGVISLNKTTKKDIDLLWVNEETKIVYYREAKGNMEMDTEKIPKMIEKIQNDIKPYIEKTYPEYTLNAGILHWSIYDRKQKFKGFAQVKKCENHVICEKTNTKLVVDHFQDFIQLCDIDWSEEDFYTWCRSIGEQLKTSHSKKVENTTNELQHEIDELKAKMRDLGLKSITIDVD